MLIDWFTVVAQAINFLVLVWLMKRFLYKPILRAIDAREKRVASELADADVKKMEAENERDAFREKNEQFDQERAALLNEARNDIRSERQRLLDEARTAAETLRAKQQEALSAELRSLHEAIRRRAQEEVFAIARKVLADLGETSLEAQMSEVFLRRLREMEESERAHFAEIMAEASGPVVVRSAFQMPEPQRALIRQTVKEALSGEFDVQFKTAPNLISGIELSANGRKVAWSIADYLTSLEERVAELVKDSEMSSIKADEPQHQDIEAKP